MHIAFLTTEYPPLPSGGIGTSIRNLAIKLVALGYRVTVMGWGHKAEFEDQGVAVRFMGSTRVPKMGWLLNRRMLQRELNRMVRNDDLKIVEAPDWCGMSAGMQLNCPVVIRCHGSSVYFAHLLNEQVRPSVRLAEKVALKYADSITAVSRFTAGETVRLFSLKKPISTISNGIDLTLFSLADKNDIDPNMILHFGTLVRKKGVVDLCKAFSSVAEQMPEASLCLVGRDAVDKLTGNSVWSLCRENLSPLALKRVEYLGFQPYVELQRYVQRAAVCVFPSFAEAMPLSWLEAMACGKAVIAYDSGWAREIVENDKTGLLLQPGDIGGLSSAMIQLLDNQSLSERFGKEGRKAVEARFSDQVVTKQSIKWYEDVVRNYRR